MAYNRKKNWVSVCTGIPLMIQSENKEHVSKHSHAVFCQWQSQIDTKYKIQTQDILSNTILRCSFFTFRIIYKLSVHTSILQHTIQ